MRTAALAGLFVAVAVPLAGAAEDVPAKKVTETVIAVFPTPNPSTCCH